MANDKKEKKGKKVAVLSKPAMESVMKRHLAEKSQRSASKESARRKGKRKISFWLTPIEIGELDEYASFLDVNMTDAMRTLLIMARKAVREGNVLQNKVNERKGANK